MMVIIVIMLPLPMTMKPSLTRSPSDSSLTLECCLSPIKMNLTLDLVPAPLRRPVYTVIR